MSQPSTAATASLSAPVMPPAATATPADPSTPPAPALNAPTPAAATVNVEHGDGAAKRTKRPKPPAGRSARKTANQPPRMQHFAATATTTPSAAVAVVSNNGEPEAKRRKTSTGDGSANLEQAANKPTSSNPSAGVGVALAAMASSSSAPQLANRVVAENHKDKKWVLGKFYTILTLSSFPISHSLP